MEGGLGVAEFVFLRENAETEEMLRHIDVSTWNTITIWLLRVLKIISSNWSKHNLSIANIIFQFNLRSSITTVVCDATVNKFPLVIPIVFKKVHCTDNWRPCCTSLSFPPDKRKVTGVDPRGRHTKIATMVWTVYPQHVQSSSLS